MLTVTVLVLSTLNNFPTIQFNRFHVNMVSVIFVKLSRDQRGDFWFWMKSMLYQPSSSHTELIKLIDLCFSILKSRHRL